MASLNLIHVIGNVGRDAELKYGNSGTAVATFSVATTETTSDGREFTEWHQVKAFGKTAEVCGQYVKKGRKVYIQGKNQTSEWERDGIKQRKTEVVANRLILLDKANSDQPYTSRVSQRDEPGPPMDKIGYVIPGYTGAVHGSEPDAFDVGELSPAEFDAPPLSPGV